MKLYTILFAVALFVIACNNRKDSQIEQVDVQVNSSAALDLSTVAQEVTPIRLETTDSALVSGVSAIKMTDEFIFINGGIVLFQFTKDGKFVRKVGARGRGPREYDYISDIEVNSERELLYVVSGKKILIFDFEGHFVDEISHDIYWENLTVTNDGLMVFSRKLAQKCENNKFRNSRTLYTLKGKEIVDSLLVRDVILDDLWGVSPAYNRYISEGNDKQYVYVPVFTPELFIRDTLYRYHDNKLSPAYKFNFAGKPLVAKGKKRLFIECMIKTDRYVIVYYEYEKTKNRFFYDEKEGKSFSVLEGFTDDRYQTGTINLRPMNTKEGLFYCKKDAYELVGNKNFEGITENDNPVLILVKMKE